MVHPISIPTLARAFQNWSLNGLFSVVLRGKLRDLEGANTVSVTRFIILTVTNELIPDGQHPARWSRDVCIAQDKRALRMFRVWTKDAIGIVETQSVVQRIPYKQPPQLPIVKQRRVDKLAIEQGGNANPICRELASPVQVHRSRFAALRNHVYVLFPLEDIGVRKVEWFIKDHLLILPLKTIGTRGKCYVTFVVYTIQCLKKHEVRVADVYQKRISNITRLYVSDISSCQDGIYRAPKRDQTQRGLTNVDTNGPMRHTSNKRNTFGPAY